MKPKDRTESLCPEGIDLLLPWYLNHTLEKGEEETVHNHLLSCPICQQELEVIEREREIYRSLAEEIPVPHTFPLLMEKIEKQERGGIWQRITALIPGDQPALATTLIVTQFVVITALVGLLATNPWGAGEKIYQTLSGPTAVTGEGPRLLILFQDGVPEKTMREVILEIGGTIVRGPTPLGIYTVELRSEVKPEELQHLVSSLRQREDVIRFVEVEGG